eukprot:TRINITY_DN28124_c0_g1_i1.p2 TRINITY_DN28124_c0_g1~~TRINITY_DN28124_c0_g1_i1.p2  ORF type:complete len:128 (+),score=13.41 TRINITY_DN28124_c0_g1_i1:302-685(+)
MPHALYLEDAIQGGEAVCDLLVDTLHNLQILISGGGQRCSKSLALFFGLLGYEQRQGTRNCGVGLRGVRTLRQPTEPSLVHLDFRRRLQREDSRSYFLLSEPQLERQQSHYQLQQSLRDVPQYQEEL